MSRLNLPHGDYNYYCKTEKLKSKSRYVRSNSKSRGNHVVSSEEKKKGCSGKDLQKKKGFKSGVKERVGDEKLIIITNNRGINDHIRFYS